MAGSVSPIALHNSVRQMVDKLTSVTCSVVKKEIAGIVVRSLVWNCSQNRSTRDHSSVAGDLRIGPDGMRQRLGFIVGKQNNK